MPDQRQRKGGVKGGHAVSVATTSSHFADSHGYPHSHHLPAHYNHDGATPEQWPKGLKNVGNTCYANATLQCLLSTALTNALLDPKVVPLFRRYSSNPNLLAKGSGSVDSEDGEEPLAPKNGPPDTDQEAETARLRRKQREDEKLQGNCQWLTRELTAITQEYTNESVMVRGSSSSSYLNWLSPAPPPQPANVVNPGSITRHPDRLSKCLHPYQQEDAHEFLRALLSTLVMNGHNKQLSSLFDGLLESAVTCKSCGRASLTRDRYMDLSLDINDPEICSLDDALYHYTKTENLEGDNAVFCLKCNKKRAVTKGLRLATAPSILVCHLKRFAFDHYGRLIRLHKRIEFPERLQIEDFMSNLNKARPPPYDLVAILVHQGQTCASGHYLAFVKKDKEWYKCNDSIVTKVDEETVFSQQAYIMMYEVAEMRERTGCTPRGKKHVPEPFMDEDDAEISKDGASNASFSWKSTDPSTHSSHQLPYQTLLRFLHNTEGITRFLTDMCCEDSTLKEPHTHEMRRRRHRDRDKKSSESRNGLRRTFSSESLQVIEVQHTKNGNGIRSQTAPRQRTHSYDYIAPGYNMDSPRTTYSAHTDENQRQRRPVRRHSATKASDGSRSKGHHPHQQLRVKSNHDASRELPPLPRHRRTKSNASSPRKIEPKIV